MAKYFKCGDWVKDRDGEFNLITSRDKDGDYNVISPDHGENMLYGDEVEASRREPWVKVATGKRKPVWITCPWTFRLEERGDFNFYLFASKDGAKILINAGCQVFTSFKAARDYWLNHNPRYTTKSDPDCEGSNELDRRSLKILDRFEKKLEEYRAGLKPAKKKRARR